QRRNMASAPGRTLARLSESMGSKNLAAESAARLPAEALKDLLRQRVLVLDGAMGTAIQGKGLTAEDFGGAAFEGCNEHLNLTRPDVIRAIHQGHLAAGADIIETNTFGSTSLVLAEYPPLHEKAAQITRAGARIAREAADAFSTPQRPRFVAGSMG